MTKLRLGNPFVFSDCSDFDRFHQGLRGCAFYQFERTYFADQTQLTLTLYISSKGGSAS